MRASSKGAILDTFSEQRQNQSIKGNIFKAKLALIWCKKGVDFFV